MKLFKVVISGVRPWGKLLSMSYAHSAWLFSMGTYYFLQTERRIKTNRH